MPASVVRWCVETSWAKYRVVNTGLARPGPVLRLEAPDLLPAGQTGPEKATRVDIMVWEPGVGCGRAVVGAWPSKPVAMTMDSGITLAVSVRDPHGDPIPGVEITVDPEPDADGGPAPVTPWMTHKITSDQHGHAEDKGLFPGAYSLRCFIRFAGIRTKEVNLNQSRVEVTIGPDDLPGRKR